MELLLEKKIIICLNPFLSHVSPILEFAKQIKEKGFSLLFVCFEEVELMICNEKIEYYVIQSCSNKKLEKLRMLHHYKELASEYCNIHFEIYSVYAKYHPQWILMSITRYPVFLLPAMYYGAKVILYSLCAGKPRINLRYPPVTSKYVPKKNVHLVDLYSVCEWIKRFVRKGIAPMVIIERAYFPWTELRRMCWAQNIRWYFGIDGFYPAFPIVILGTEIFEFKPNVNMKFAGICVEEIHKMDDKPEELNFEDITKPIVYCCLGTMSSRYLNANVFYKELINLFMNNPQWNLLLSLGNPSNKSRIKRPAPNIHIVNFVEQRRILKHINLVITHGGYGTIKECIVACVPMIVVSCSYDQHGNAARVQYHGIGLKSTLLHKSISQKILHRGNKKIKIDIIKKCIEKILAQKLFYENISAMKAHVIRANEFNKLVNDLFWE